MEHMTPEPKRRGNLRLWLGVRFFRARRWLWWHTSGVKFARRRPGAECPVVCARHATPLMRKLKDVDMWLQENKVINLRLAAARLDGVPHCVGIPAPYAAIASPWVQSQSEGNRSPHPKIAQPLG